ncbi:MAG: hypothetical protein Q9217_005659 [Psora testacea]
MSKTAQRNHGAPSSTHSTPRPVSRASNINKQIYQFALGYPQTPPETSPEFGQSQGESENGVSERRNDMGSFLFRWDHPAEDVYVTGTFDDWAKSVRLDKKDGYFEKLVDLPYADKKIYYKFVVDGNWTTDHTAPQETDEANNVNNVLLPKNIAKQNKMTDGIGAIISGVRPGSTTTQLAAGVPKESPSHWRAESAASDVPGTYPETPFHDAQEFSINPIPATAGAGNPVSLKPGEKVPHPSTVTENSVNSTVTLDKAAYDNAGATQSQQTGGTQGGMFGVPPIGKGVIPESSLPMGADVPSEKDMGPMIQSAGAGTSTAALAAKVPKEPRGVPEVVTESQHQAGLGPEASGNREAVEEKRAMEKELESKVPEEPAISDGTAVGGASGVPPSVQQSIEEMNKTVPIAPAVPDVVQESIVESHQSPEAAGSSTMVSEKAAVEDELLKGVKPTDAAGEPAPSSSAALTDTAPAPTESQAPSEPITTAAAPAQTPGTKSAMAQAVEEQQPESRDISPMSHPAGRGRPVVTTGVDSSTTSSKSTPAGASASPVSKTSAGTSTDKKSKRSSGLFGKLKEKLKK